MPTVKVERFQFDQNDKCALVEMLGSSLHVNDLADVVANYKAGKILERLHVSPGDTRKALMKVSRAAWKLYETLNEIPDDLKQLYAFYVSKAIDNSEVLELSPSDASLTINTQDFVHALVRGGDYAVNFSPNAKTKSGRPTSNAQLQFIHEIRDILLRGNHKITSSENGTFVTVLDICSTAAGYPLEETRNLARRVTRTSGKNPT